MAACTLDIGPRRVLVSEEGPPAAEFALFDASDIELAPGEAERAARVGLSHHRGADAARRLAVAGVTLDFAQECADLVHGGIAETYARGPLVRRLARLLGAHELFDGGTYDATLRRYAGTWLDLALLTNDAGIASSDGGFATRPGWRCSSARSAATPPWCSPRSDTRSRSAWGSERSGGMPWTTSPRCRAR